MFIMSFLLIILNMIIYWLSRISICKVIQVSVHAPHNALAHESAHVGFHAIRDFPPSWPGIAQLNFRTVWNNARLQHIWI